MCIICNNNYNINTTSIDCSNCPLVTTIPDGLINLKTLNCSNCQLITHIPKYLINLEYIYCLHCPILTFIPNEFVKLIVLNCSNCHLLISIPKKVSYLNCIRCNWLKESYENDKIYERQIKKLIKIQRLFKFRKIKLNLSIDIINYILKKYYLVI